MNNVRRVLLYMMLVILFGITEVHALTPAANSGPVAVSDTDVSIGAFGGVKGSRFLLILNDGIRRYYGVESSIKVFWQGRLVNLSVLPPETTIKVLARKGAVEEVTVQEAGK